MNKQKLTILGATGSIGVSTLDVVARHPERYEVVALAGNTRVEVLLDQCLQHRPRFAVVGQEVAAAAVPALADALHSAGLATEVLATHATTSRMRAPTGSTNEATSVEFAAHAPVGLMLRGRTGSVAPNAACPTTW